MSAWDQYKSLTLIRADDPVFSQFSVAAQRSALLKLDSAFQAFFRRMKNGEAPGFPRFRGRDRSINSFDVSAPNIKTHGKHVVLSARGIGKFRFRCELPEGALKGARVVNTARRINLQLIVEKRVESVQDIREPLGST